MTKLSSIKHITFILIWVINKLRNHIDTSNRNMPKSGWINRIELITTKIIILKINELSSLFLYLFKSNELTTMKLGLKNSEGWKEKSNNLIPPPVRLQQRRQYELSAGNATCSAPQLCLVFV